ncbi:hypothetical protein [uncultured Amphritea sp.]|uniref:hypothetical protein n=1 Tax=uncultured Amphritea sp. TaxID=981605 RepID=UPI002635CC36|nr:hypothetical protein [uncultured Amphritea sp.]
MPRKNEQEFLSQVLQGHSDAINMCCLLFKISQVLDDLIDKDRPVHDIDVVRSYWDALIYLPENSFYRRHEMSIRPLMAAALQDWMDATRLEKGHGHHGKHLAFVLRDQLTSIVIHCAGIIGGFDYMQGVSKDIRLHFHEDSLSDYMRELEV